MATPAPADSPSPLGALRGRLTVASVLLAMAAAVLDASSVNVALPAMTEQLHTDASTIAWVVIAYQAALAACLLPLAAVGERFGYRRSFIAGLIVFLCSAVLAGTTSSLPVLLALRVCQGAGAAAIMALGLAIVRQVMGQEQFARAIGWNAMTVAVTSAAGPTVGATLLSVGGWHMVFSGGATLALSALALSAALPAGGRSQHSFAPVSILFYLSIIPAFIAATAILRTRPLLSLLLTGLAVAGIAMLVRREKNSPSLLPLDLVQNLQFARSVAASIACFSAMSLALLMLPFALQARMHASTATIGLMLTPWPLSVLLTTPVTAKLLKTVAPSNLCAVGGVNLALGFALLATGGHAPNPILHLVAIVVCGIGCGLFQTPNNRNMFLAAPASRAAAAGGVQGTARLAGQATGAIAGSVLLRVLPIDAAVTLAFAAATCAALLAAVISVANAGRQHALTQQP